MKKYRPKDTHHELDIVTHIKTARQVGNDTVVSYENPSLGIKILYSE